MKIDSRLEMCSDIAVTGSTGTNLIGSQIDTQQVNLNIGSGEPIYLVIAVSTAITVSTSTGTHAFKLVSDDSAAISTTSSTVHLVTATYTGNQAKGKKLFVGVLPAGVYERYLGILDVVGTEVSTAGKVDAYLTLNPPAWKATPDSTSLNAAGIGDF